MKGKDLKLTVIHNVMHGRKNGRFAKVESSFVSCSEKKPFNSFHYHHYQRTAERKFSLNQQQTFFVTSAFG